MAEAGADQVRWEPFEDFVVNEKAVALNGQVFRYPRAIDLFIGKPPAKYERFRDSWLIIRRERPVVPCPEQTPLPSKHMCKANRAKIFSVYLRPWTLAKKIATTEVP